MLVSKLCHKQCFCVFSNAFCNQAKQNEFLGPSYFEYQEFIKQA